MGWPGSGAEAGPALSPAQGPGHLATSCPLTHTPSRATPPAPSPREGFPQPGWFLSPCGYTETRNEGKPGKKENPDLSAASSRLGREWSALSQPRQPTVPCTGIRTYSTIHNTRS